MNHSSVSSGRRLAIITDTTSTIKPDQIKDVYVVSMLITLEDKKSLRDGREISINEVYKYLRENPKTANIKTSSPQTADMIQTATEAAQKYDDVIILPVTSGLSGTYNQWKTALESDDQLAKFQNLHLFETNDIALSLKWLVEDVLLLSQNGASISELREYTKEWHNRIACTVILNDLTQAKRGGRIGKVKALLAGLFKFKPILQFYKGRNDIIDKTFTNKMAIEKSFTLFQKLLEITKTSNKISKIGFCHSFSSQAKANEIFQELKVYASKHGISTIDQGQITPVISAHTGNDAFSINVLIEPIKK
ncbi:DegV family protein [[Mycoplasma] testudinis]|uniref:DegV family protein n=1 Tax=[Mycoplasma] testudinis TaxID=33924 RepID=UPI00056353CB|nr:DegV family protein [[Mycoplasma] testudinis]